MPGAALLVVTGLVDKNLTAIGTGRPLIIVNREEDTGMAQLSPASIAGDVFAVDLDGFSSDVHRLSRFAVDVAGLVEFRQLTVWLSALTSGQCSAGRMLRRAGKKS